MSCRKRSTNSPYHYYLMVRGQGNVVIHGTMDYRMCHPVVTGMCSCNGQGNVVTERSRECDNSVVKGQGNIVIMLSSSENDY